MRTKIEVLRILSPCYSCERGIMSRMHANSRPLLQNIHDKSSDTLIPLITRLFMYWRRATIECAHFVHWFQPWWRNRDQITHMENTELWYEVLNRGLISISRRMNIYDVEDWLRGVSPPWNKTPPMIILAYTYLS